MKEQIEAVQKYFKDKILAKDYLIKKIENYLIYLIIDEKYEFVIWIGNWDIKKTRKNHEHSLSFMNLEFTDDEAFLLHDTLKSAVEGYTRGTLIEQKKKELEELEKQLS